MKKSLRVSIVIHCVALACLSLIACPPEPVITTYTVTYIGGGNTGGSVPIDTNTYVEGQTVVVLGNSGSLVKTGFTFIGWNTQNDGNGTTYTSGRTFIMGDYDVTLYAKWTNLPTYSVTYIGGGNTGGSVPYDANSYLQGQMVTVLGNNGNLVRTGLAFSGWNTQDDGNGTTYAPGQSFIMPSSNVTFYAVWVLGYSVEYLGGGNTGGSVPIEAYRYLGGQTVTVLGNNGNLVRTGYVFMGWNTQNDGKGTTYTSGQTFLMPSSNVMLYAKWAPIITTVAGNGTRGYSGNGGPATSAAIGTSVGVAVDTVGNIYITDYEHDDVRKVDTLGVITRVAGNGSSGYSGDGGPATSASLYDPYGVTVDSAGNIYIAEYWSCTIRKIDTLGVITTVAGNGSSGYSGDGGLATSAKLNRPYDVAVDTAGNIYIADADNARIRKVDTMGVITTVARVAAVGITVDTAGNLFCSTLYRVVKIDTLGVITTVAGDGTSGYAGDGGPATSAKLNPWGVVVDSVGNLFIGDAENSRVRMVDTLGVITTVAGDGTSGDLGDGGLATSASLYSPCGIAVDSAGNLYIADQYNFRTRKVWPQP